MPLEDKRRERRRGSNFLIFIAQPFSRAKYGTQDGTGAKNPLGIRFSAEVVIETLKDMSGGTIYELYLSRVFARTLGV